MEFSVRHFISGRIRLHLPSLCRKRKLAEAAVTWLQAQQGIKSARLNFDCGCLIIEYDPSFEGVLRATLGRLSLMSLDELQLLVDPAKSAATCAPTGAATGRTGDALAPHPASAADRIAVDGVQPQPGRAGHQYAAHAVERLPDRTMRLAGMAA